MRNWKPDKTANVHLSVHSKCQRWCLLCSDNWQIKIIYFVYSSSNYHCCAKNSQLYLLYSSYLAIWEYIWVWYYMYSNVSRSPIMNTREDSNCEWMNELETYHSGQSCKPGFPRIDHPVTASYLSYRQHEYNSNYMKAEHSIPILMLYRSCYLLGKHFISLHIHLQILFL